MNLLLITTLLVSGLCSLSSTVLRQFHVEKEQKNWTEAQQYCREEFTDLATIDNMAEMEEVKRLIQEAGAGNAWIGLQEKWQWSLADRDFYGENEAEFRNWAGYPIQPNGMGPPYKFKDVNCVIQWAKENGKWNDYGCSETFPFICYDGGNLTQPYVLVNESKTWADAQRYCRENHTDLASVRNQTENDLIWAMFGGRNIWIGLFKAWEWSDGSNSSFRSWGTGEPNATDVACTEMKQDFLWNDASCHLKNNFICYEDKLVLVRENKTWNEALQYCQDRNMDLVSVHSERIQHWMTERAKGASTDHVWLGLRHACDVGWSWVFGESIHYSIHYSNWAPDQEQVQGFQRVGAVKSGGDWGQEEGQWVSNLPETEKLNFICTTEGLKRQIVRVELQVDSQVNIRDPAVHLALLQQIQQRLREKGMPAAKLTWMKQPDGKIFHEKN